MKATNFVFAQVLGGVSLLMIVKIGEYLCLYIK